MTEPRTDDTEMIELPAAPERRVGSPDGTAAASTDASAGDRPSADAATTSRRGRSSLRWGLALLGVLIVAAGTALIVSLAGGRPTASSAMGWMPSGTTSYTEVRLDLPGDQRQKLAAYLANFPGFKDQTQLEPKLDDVLDRIVRLASHDAQTWTTDIKPWFGGQVASGMGGSGEASASGMVGLAGRGMPLVVVSLTDRTKATDWLVRTIGTSGSMTRSSYNGADLFSSGSDEFRSAVAVTDTAFLLGSEAAVKAAVDSKGAGTLAQNEEMKAALATLDTDHVLFGVTRIRAQYE